VLRKETNHRAGAGAAGSSAAYHLRKYATEHDLAVNITVFEKTDRIGGRTLTIRPFDVSDASHHVELGASIFITLNAILYNATRDFGLETTTREADGVDGILAFWDGDKIRFDIDSSHSEWRTKARLVWRYGYYALKNSQALMHKTVAKFLNLYEPPYFPFKSLTQRTYELELLEETSSTGEEFLRKNKVRHTVKVTWRGPIC
jgi:prenylcysteine oxidase/farnesylcysteine lyase